MSETSCTAENVAPPSIERTANRPSCESVRATVTSVPSGRTTGCAPKPVDVAATGVDHVWPPSTEAWEAIPPLITSVHSR